MRLWRGQPPHGVTERHAPPRPSGGKSGEGATLVVATSARLRGAGGQNPWQVNRSFSSESQAGAPGMKPGTGLQVQFAIPGATRAWQASQAWFWGRHSGVTSRVNSRLSRNAVMQFWKVRLGQPERMTARQ